MINVPTIDIATIATLLVALFTGLIFWTSKYGHNVIVEFKIAYTTNEPGIIECQLTLRNRRPYTITLERVGLDPASTPYVMLWASHPHTVGNFEKDTPVITKMRIPVEPYSHLESPRFFLVSKTDNTEVINVKLLLDISSASSGSRTKRIKITRRITLHPRTDKRKSS